MPRDCRRLLVHPDRVRAMFSRMRAELDAMADRHAAEAASLRRELDTTKAEFAELCRVVRARQNAEAELASLHRERSIQRAQAADRDPAAALN